MAFDMRCCMSAQHLRSSLTNDFARALRVPRLRLSVVGHTRPAMAHGEGWITLDIAPASLEEGGPSSKALVGRLRKQIEQLSDGSSDLLLGHLSNEIDMRQVFASAVGRCAFQGSVFSYTCSRTSTEEW